MEQAAITFIINGNTYRISASDGDTIRQIPKGERQQLIELLEAVKLQDRLAATAVQQAAARATANVASTGAGTAADYRQAKPERLGSGDVDDLMAHLIMEERRRKKPAASAQTIYKWAAGIMVLIVLSVWLF